MAMLSIDNLEAGMVLAKDVLDRNGRMLLGAGAELTQKHLVTFRTWGVTEAAIEGIEEEEEALTPLPADVDPEALAAAEEQLLPLFSLAGTEHPAMRELLRLAALKKVLHGLC